MNQKLLLSTNDLLLIRDQDFLLKKREVTTKIAKLLSLCELQLKDIIEDHTGLYPEKTLIRSGKISRGENYKGLPYLVLDFPRYSIGKEVFIYRTMFWWGHYFLCLLVTENCGLKLSGQTEIAGSGFMQYLGSSPWNFDLRDQDWKPLNEGSDSTHPFIAVGRKVDFDQLHDLPQITTTTFQKFMSLLTK